MIMMILIMHWLILQMFWQAFHIIFSRKIFLIFFENKQKRFSINSCLKNFLLDLMNDNWVLLFIEQIVFQQDNFQNKWEITFRITHGSPLLSGVDDQDFLRFHNNCLNSKAFLNVIQIYIWRKIKFWWFALIICHVLVSKKPRN